MKNLNSVVFPDSLPSLDLHGYDRDYAKLMVKDFINDNIKQKIETFTIIHGNGSGILKRATHDVLRKNSNVLEYKINCFNSGCTIVLIACKKNK
ncbi:MAG: Smr/MutS family protein [Bacilli bacterium]|nr:Smr/MutS family protein [Bacilli bacterium]